MSDFPHEYMAYGLRLRSNRPLPGLAAPAGGAADASGPATTIDFAGPPDGVLLDAPYTDDGFETLWHRADGGWRFRYVDPRDPGATFWTLDLDAAGARLVVRWSADWLLDDIPALLQGLGLAAALHVRGIPLLHGAVPVVGGGAIAIVGDSGAGKSTTAAAFVARGHAIMADDVAALAIDGASTRVHAGPPRLRVYAEPATAAGFSGEGLPRLFAADVLGPKRYIPLSAERGSFHGGTLPLRAVYVLQPRAPGAGAPTIEPLPARRALPELLRHAYLTRLLDSGRRAALLPAFAHVAATVPVRTVRARDDLAALPHLIDAIVADAIAADAEATAPSARARRIHSPA